MSSYRAQADCDLVIKHSGVGAEDELLERAVLDCASTGTRVAFWDVDAPATLARVEQNGSDPFRALIPKYDFIFTYGGGSPVIEHYRKLGAAKCHPVYNGLDPDCHFPVKADPKLKCDLAFVGHRLPDREKRVEQYFLRAAELAPEMSFILGGEGWGGKKLPAKRALDRARRHRSAQRRELFGANGVEPESRFDGESWILAAYQGF